MDQKYLGIWEHNIRHNDTSRLQFYKTINGKFRYEDYLEMRDFDLRKHISKLRCSSHDLRDKKKSM